MCYFIKFFAISVFIVVAVQSIKALTAGIKSQKTDDEYNSLVTMALFDKLNWLVREIKTVNQQNMNLIRRFKSQQSSLLALKAEVRELLQQQDLKTEKLFWQMKLDTLESFVLQENLLKNTTLNLEYLKSYDIVALKQNRNWQTILRRQDGSVNFNRSWNDYKFGFGNANGEFFVGLEKLYAMTTYADPQELLIILQDFDNQTRYARYDDFVIGSEEEKYKLKKIGQYKGDAEDSLSQHLNCAFSTYDRDNDNTTTSHCAKHFEGGWWFSACYNSHLTGPYLRHSKIVKEREKGLVWHSWHGLEYSLKYAEMLIRPK